MDNKSTTKFMQSDSITSDEVANLKKVSDIDNSISRTFNNLIICNANETHTKEISELWANLATIQQIISPERYNFKLEGKDWQVFVRKKLSKNNNLLLVAYDNDKSEIKGFLYLQTVTLPSSNLILKGVTEEIYTKPQYRKAGIASRLLEVAIEWANSQSVKQIDFIAPAESRDLLGFYSKTLNELNKNVNLELVTF